MTDTDEKAASEALRSDDQVRRILLDDIVIEKGFNIRQVIDLRSESFRELTISIRERPGLHTPIGLRKRPDGKYSVVFGHRRVMSYRRILESVKVTAPNEIEFFSRIDAFVREYDDLSALMANASENVAREDLRPFEIAARAVDIHLRYGITYLAIAKKFGISPGYLSTLVAAETRLHPRLLRIFRGQHAGRDTVTMTDLLYLARIERQEEQIERYEALLSEREKLRILAERTNIYTFGSKIHVDEIEDIATPTIQGRRISYKNVQGALLSIREAETIRIDGKEQPLTQRDASVARAMLRWVLGLDERSPIIGKKKKKGAA